MVCSLVSSGFSGFPPTIQKHPEPNWSYQVGLFPVLHMYPLGQAPATTIRQAVIESGWMGFIPGCSHNTQVSSVESSFWTKCQEAGCIESVFSPFISLMKKLSERMVSKQASEEGEFITIAHLKNIMKVKPTGSWMLSSQIKRKQGVHLGGLFVQDTL